MELGLVCPVGSFSHDLSSREMKLTDPEKLVVYARKLDVINRGLSGFNTEWAIPVFEQVGWLDFLIRVSRTAN